MNFCGCLLRVLRWFPTLQNGRVRNTDEPQGNRNHGNTLQKKEKQWNPGTFVRTGPEPEKWHWSCILEKPVCGMLTSFISYCYHNQAFIILKVRNQGTVTYMRVIFKHTWINWIEFISFWFSAQAWSFWIYIFPNGNVPENRSYSSVKNQARVNWT